MPEYVPKVLRVDLSTGRSREEEIPASVVESFVGGRGFGAWYLYNELSAGTEPLSPENKLILLAGPLAGTNAQSVSRWMAVTRSPLTGTYYRSVGGGDFGAWLRFAGYHLLILEGKAARPSYLYIDEKGAQVRDASSLRGLTTSETQARLKEAHGRNVRMACIGPAGEKLVRFAGIFSDRRCAGRGGTGAVMASKNLKAVAINAERRVSVAEPERFRELVRSQVETLSGKSFEAFRRYGTGATQETTNYLGIYPTANFRYGRLENDKPISAKAYDALTERSAGCYSCMLRCGKVRRVREGMYAGSWSEGPEYESIWAFTGPIESEDIGATVAADYLCDELGIDTISAGNAIGFAFELFEKGIIGASDTEGLELVRGNHQAMMELVRRIGQRRGLGDLLAEGVQRAASTLGKGAADYAVHAKGLELPAYEPRGAKAHGLSYATSNIGGSHNMGYARQEIFGATDPRKVDRFAEEGKGDITKYNQDHTAAMELGIVCTFISGRGFGIEPFGQMLSAVTGVPQFADEAFLWQAGERVYNMERLFNAREGFRRRDDAFPKRTTTERLERGASAGQVVAHPDAMLDEYYQARGWTKRGMPGAKKLRELGLADLRPQAR